jgi:hypothetical protein
MSKMSYKKLYEYTVDNIMNTKSIKNIDNTLWYPYYEAGAKCSSVSCRGMNILILNAPCNGFGDLIFAIKLSKYLKKWYGAYVTIATTFDKGLLNLGADPKYVVGLVGGKSTQCRRFANLKLNKGIPKQDLILVAPMQIDFEPDIKDVRKLIPYATVWNTFTFSEYNDSTQKNFTFNTGIGKDRDGILLTKTDKSIGKPKGLKNPYSVVYVAASLGGLTKCILSFVEMVAKKYHKKHNKLDIVIPPWFSDEDMDKQLKKKISKYYPNIIIISKENKSIIISEGDSSERTLTFRCDILPVPNKMMIKLMSNSIDDILLTGDQSITDALSCCSNKNIFYQIAPWKSDLGKNLAKYMPNIYLKKVSTSCGTLSAIKYKSNYKEFIKNWDFRTRARGKMDAIMLSTKAIKSDKNIQDLSNIISNNRTLQSIKNKLRKEEVSNNVKTRRRNNVKSRRRKSIRPKRCIYGVKKSGGCKKKTGPKKSRI